MGKWGQMHHLAISKSEGNLNNHSKAWAKLLNMGMNAGNFQPRRIKEALTVKNSNVAQLRGLRKDHKVTHNAVAGPPLRPLCNGKVGPNAPLGNLMARLLKTVRSGMAQNQLNTEVLSTEEVLYHLEQFNNEARNEVQRMQPGRGCKVPGIQNEEVVIGSMDVAALYPNCKVAPTVNKVEESINQCGLEFEQINKSFLTKFVSVLTRGEVQDEEVRRFVQVPKPRTTLNSYMKRQSEDQFQGPPMEQLGNLTPGVIRKLVAIAAGKSVSTVMQNHFFQIGGKIYKQKDGAAIGLDLSVEACSLYMTKWDHTFLAKLRRMGIHVSRYIRYVDDIVILLRAISPGWSFDLRSKKLVFNENDATLTCDSDVRTFEVLRDIANTLDSNIQMEVDVPSRNPNGRLPVLDLGLYIEENIVKHGFYSKPMSNPFVIMYNSAIPNSTKQSSLLQEGLRRIRNMGQNVPNLEKISVLNKFMNSLMISGYDHQYRYHMLRGILNREREIEEQILSGHRRRYRNRDQIQEQKNSSMGKYANTWFLSGKNQNTLKVQGAPESALLESLRKPLKNNICAEGGSTKFVEMGGKPITAGLSNTVKFTGQQGCVFTPKCNVDPELDCREGRLVYQTECLNCAEDPAVIEKSVYIGTSGHLLHKRNLEHMGDIRRGNMSNALSKHHRLMHNNIEPKFSSRSLRGGIQYNLDKFILKGRKINQASSILSVE